jgi:hypothetical protein
MIIHIIIILAGINTFLFYVLWTESKQPYTETLESAFMADFGEKLKAIKHSRDWRECDEIIDNFEECWKPAMGNIDYYIGRLIEAAAILHE